MAPRPSLVERLAATLALGPRRRRAAARVSRAKREAMAPRPPARALEAYASVMRTYAARVEALTEKHVLSALPVLGSGDVLDVAALEAGIVELEAELGVLADRSRRSASAAAKRSSEHARVEAQRVLGVSIPKTDPRAAWAVGDFAEIGVLRLRKAGEAQAAKMRAAIAAHTEGESMRADILQSLWVSRVRSQAIARDQVYGLHAQVLRAWSLAAGSGSFVWHTRHDERVRPGHNALDGKTFLWSAPPDTGGGEGHNLPGSPHGCRCVAIPAP